MYVQNNIERLEQLRTLAKNHILTCKFEENANSVYVVFSENYCGFGGVRVAFDEGKIKAYEKLLNRMNVFYNATFGWSSHHTELKSI